MEERVSWMFFFVCVLMQALKQAFPTGTFLKNGIVQGVKVREVH